MTKEAQKNIKVPENLQGWIVLREKEDLVTKYRLFPYRPVLVTLVGYLFTGMLPAIFAIVILVMSGMYGYFETPSVWLGTTFLLVSLFLAFLLHKYVVIPAKSALKSYVDLEVYPDEIVVQQIFPDAARESTIHISREKIKGVICKQEKSIGYRVGIKVDPQVFPRADNTVYLGSYGTKENAKEVQKFLQAIVSKRK